MGLAASHYQSVGPTETAPCDLVGLEPTHLLTPTFACRIAPASSPLPGACRLSPCTSAMAELLLTSQPNQADSSPRHTNLHALSITPDSKTATHALTLAKQRAQIRSELRMKATCRVLSGPSRPSRDREQISSRFRPRHDHHHPPPQHHAPHRLSVPFGIAEQPTASIDPLSSP